MILVVTSVWVDVLRSHDTIDPLACRIAALSSGVPRQADVPPARLRVSPSVSPRTSAQRQP